MTDANELFHDFRSIDYPVIDADAHVQEPEDLWTTDAPASLRERVPRVTHSEHGDFWLFDKDKPPEAVAFTVSAGKSYLDYYPTGGRYATIRPGTWQPEARLRDMAIDGIYAQGRTYEEVAASTGIPLGTMKRRLRDALASLRERLVLW